MAKKYKHNYGISFRDGQGLGFIIFRSNLKDFDINIETYIEAKNLKHWEYYDLDNAPIYIFSEVL